LNLEILAPRQKVWPEGDVFVFRPKGRPFYYGRVVKPDTWVVDLMNRKPVWRGCLIYLYRIHSTEPVMPRALPLTELLLPPLIVQLQAWRVGLFQRVGLMPFSRADRFARHCFKLPDGSRLDESGKPIRRRTGPCGDYGLTPIRGLDDKIHTALGLPLAPD
jgi:hypothetical protein